MMKNRSVYGVYIGCGGVFTTLTQGQQTRSAFVFNLIASFRKIWLALKRAVCFAPRVPITGSKDSVSAYAVWWICAVLDCLGVR